MTEFSGNLDDFGLGLSTMDSSIMSSPSDGMLTAASHVVPALLVTVHLGLTQADLRLSPHRCGT